MPTARAALSAAVAASVFCFVPLAAVPAHAVPAATQPSIVVPSAVNYHYKNCKALNKKYAHGVGRSNAKDKTSGKKVTNFKHSTALYKKIIARNHGLDRDHDGSACEKH